MVRGIEVLLFDMGGVLFDISAGVRCMLQWMNWSINEEQLLRRWTSSSPVRQFELGEIDSRAFAEAIVRDFHLPVSESEFIRKYSTWFESPYDGAVEMVQRLSKEYITASFTNTNEIQWSKFCESGLVEHMKYNFASHEIGKLKPDKEGFAYVIDHLNCDPRKILFFDDTQVNVDVANLMNIHGYKVRGIEELKVKLKNLIGFDYSA